MSTLPFVKPRPAEIKQDETGFRDFAGIVNTKTAKENAKEALRSGTNVEIDDKKRIKRRSGYSLFAAGAYRAAYATNDQSKLYAVIGTDLVRVMPDGVVRVLHSGLSPDMPPGGFCWHEDPSNYVAYTDGIDSGIIRRGLQWLPLVITTPTITNAAIIGTGAHQTLPFHLGDTYTTNSFRIFATYLLDDGRESAPSAVWSLSGAPEVSLLQVTVPLQYTATNLYCATPGGSTYMLVGTTTSESFTVPVADLLATGGVEYPYSTAVEGMPDGCRQLTFYNGTMLVSEYLQDRGISVVWESLPLQYHLFNKAENFFTVIGEVVLFLATPKGLIIGTDNQIYSWDGTTLTEVAQYGVVPGSCGDVLPNGTAYFWTLRGVAKAFPYELITEQHFSGDPGVFNHARLFFEHGFVKLLASTVAGNDVFNQRKERT